MRPRPRQADVRAIDAETLDQMEDLEFLLDWRVLNRGGLQAVGPAGSFPVVDRVGFRRMHGPPPMISLFLAPEEINGLGARRPLSLRVISELNREPDVGPVAERGHVRRPRRGARRDSRCIGLNGLRTTSRVLRSWTPARPVLARGAALQAAVVDAAGSGMWARLAGAAPTLPNLPPAVACCHARITR